MVGFSFKNPIFFCSLIFLAYLAGLWGTSIPLTGDQKVYLSAALEMFEKKQWIIPTLFGEANFLKPPFQYWATIIGWKVFGLSIFGALLPSVLALVSASFLTFKIGKKISLREPALAAVLFSATLGSMTYGSTAQMEVWIVLFLLAAWLAVLYSRIALAFVLVGVMAWVKGPLYPVLWTASLMIWNWRMLQSKKFWFSLLVGSGIGLGWYFLAAQTHEKEMFQQFFYTENLGKIGTHQGSIVGLWSEFIFSLFPWNFILLIGLTQFEVRERWKLNQKFYLSYSLVSILFFTLFPYRVNSYLYFLTPIMAMMASEIDLSVRSKVKTMSVGVYAVVFLFITVLMVQLFRGNWISADIVFSAVVTVLIFLVGFFRGEWKHVVFASLILVNLIRVSAVQIGERDVAGLKDEFQQHPGEYAYYIESKDIWHEYGLMSSSVGRSLHRIYNKSDADSFLAQGGLLILQDDQDAYISEQLNCVVWPRLKRRAKFPIQKMLREGIVWGDPEITRNYHICSIK